MPSYKKPTTSEELITLANRLQHLADKLKELAEHAERQPLLLKIGTSIGMLLRIEDNIGRAYVEGIFQTERRMLIG